MRKSHHQYGSLVAAATKVTDEFANEMKPINSPLVAQALKEQKEMDEKDVKSQIISVLERARQQRDAFISNIRQLRKAVEQNKKSLDKVDNAEKHGLKTGDFRPLLAVLGFDVEGFDASTWTK